MSLQNYESFDKKNNKLSLLSQFKNETLNLKVWIDHYIWQGVDKIYLIDNDSDDNPLEILQPYIDKGIVDYTFNPEKYKQVEHYKELIINKNIQNETKWLIICDSDEFFYAPNKKLSDVLPEFEQYDVIYSNWKLFGSNGLIYHPEDIRKSIVMREKEININIKHIVNIKKIDINYIDLHELNSHRCLDWLRPIDANNNNNFIIENDKIKLNHYPIQSLEFFQKVKMLRGDATCSTNVRDMNYFYEYDKNANYNDTELKDMIP